MVELPPMHQFIQHLLHDVLMKRTLDKVTKLIRKLHWEDPDVSTPSVSRCFNAAYPNYRSTTTC